MTHKTPKIRIQKLLAEAGVESRRHVEDMVVERRISVNGQLVTRLPVMIDPLVDTVTVDGQPIEIKPPGEAEKIYVLVHKPKGVYCTNVAQGEQKRAIDLLPPEIDKRIYPVGRLDADSRGLLLLTNDGDLTQKLTHPKFGVSKTYTAVVDGFVSPETAERLSDGIWLADPEKGGFKTGRSVIKVIKRAGKTSVLQITIREGRNRQLRRMLAGVGHKVRELTRIKIGPLELGRLKDGDYRMLNAWEVAQLREAIKPKTARPGEKVADKTEFAPIPPNSKPGTVAKPIAKAAVKKSAKADRPDRPDSKAGPRPKSKAYLDKPRNSATRQRRAR